MISKENFYIAHRMIIVGNDPEAKMQTHLCFSLMKIIFIFLKMYYQSNTCCHKIREEATGLHNYTIRAVKFAIGTSVRKALNQWISVGEAPPFRIDFDNLYGLCLVITTFGGWPLLVLLVGPRSLDILQ